MPRFGTKALLIAVAGVALWFSTFAGYSAARDVRTSLLLLISVASGVAAVYSQGKCRAFWACFCVVMFMCGGNDLNRYSPTFQPYTVFAPPPVPPGRQAPPASLIAAQRADAVRRDAIFETKAAVWTLGLATLAGLIGVYIHNQSVE